jgi:hypothetical protein
MSSIETMDATTVHQITGISQQEALNRLEKFGYNELKSDSSRGIFRIVFGAIK